MYYLVKWLITNLITLLDYSLFGYDWSPWDGRVLQERVINLEQKLGQLAG
jgi:hypothetical protein